MINAHLDMIFDLQDECDDFCRIKRERVKSSRPPAATHILVKYSAKNIRIRAEGGGTPEGDRICHAHSDQE